MFSLIKEFDSQGKDHLGNLSFTKGKLTKQNSRSATLLNALLMVGIFLRNFLHLRDDYKYTVFNRDSYDFLKKKNTNYPLSSFVAQRKKKLYNSRHFVQERRGNEYHMACLLWEVIHYFIIQRTALGNKTRLCIMGSWSQEYSGNSLPASYNLSPPVTLKLPLSPKTGKFWRIPKCERPDSKEKQNLRVSQLLCQFRGGDGSILIKP